MAINRLSLLLMLVIGISEVERIDDIDMKRVGLVLSSSPGYSETFFYNKVRVLNDAGFKVILFSDRFSRSVPNCQQVSGYKLPGSLVIRILKVVMVVLGHIVFSPRHTLRFILFERKDGRSFFVLVRNLYRSVHILSHSLDWVHFGFVTLAVGRENVARAMGAKMGVSLRGYDVSIYPLKHPGCYSLAWKRVDKVHTISDDLYSIALSLGLPKSTTMVKITPAIDVSRFNKRRSSSSGRCIQILTTARLHWKKGLDIALGAMKLLKQNGVSFRYEIVGDGDDYDRLVYLRHILDLNDEVFFLLKKTPNELAELLSQADLYIQPSIQEGFCNSTLEAQASGLLCIVSNAEGLSENVLNEVTGWVVPRLDSSVLASKILEVIGMSRSQKDFISRTAIRRVSEQFNLLNHQKLFIGFFD